MRLRIAEALDDRANRSDLDQAGAEGDGSSPPLDQGRLTPPVVVLQLISAMHRLPRAGPALGSQETQDKLAGAISQNDGGVAEGPQLKRVAVDDYMPAAAVRVFRPPSKIPPAVHCADVKQQSARLVFKSDFHQLSQLAD